MLLLADTLREMRSDDPDRGADAAKRGEEQQQFRDRPEQAASPFFWLLPLLSSGIH